MLRFLPVLALALSLGGCAEDKSCNSCSTDSDCSGSQTCRPFENVDTGALSFRCAAPAASTCTSTAGSNPVVGPTAERFQSTPE